MVFNHYEPGPDYMRSFLIFDLLWYISVWAGVKDLFQRVGLRYGFSAVNEKVNIVSHFHPFRRELNCEMNLS